MLILTLDELPESLESQRAMLHLSALGGFLDRRALRYYRTHTHSFSEYAGLFAVDRDELIGQLFVLRIPYTFPHGRETVAGIAGVTTRADAARRGVGRALMEAAHTREQNAGVRHCLLWTRPAWVAHGLYEKVGYRDVFRDDWAVHIIERARRPPAGWKVRRGRRTDLSVVETLHAKRTAGRLGFTPRPPHAFRSELNAGHFDPSHLLLARRKGRLAGYALLDPAGKRSTLCGEMVTVDSEAREVLLDAIETRNLGSAVAFGNSVVRDDLSVFRDRGYTIRPAGWRCLMGFTFGGSIDVQEAVQEFATHDPRFVCFSSDLF